MGKPMVARKNVDPNVAEAMAATRFWLNVSISDDDACWEWKGDRAKSDYGVFFWHGRLFPAHELAVTFTTGEMKSEGLVTCHSCDNPPCVNPRHLRFDTHLGNSRDAVERDRHARGERNGHSRVTAEQVVEMRHRRAAGARLDVLAADYGLTVPGIRSIVAGVTWAHVGGPTQILPVGRPRKAAA